MPGKAQWRLEPHNPVNRSYRVTSSQGERRTGERDRLLLIEIGLHVPVEKRLAEDPSKLIRKGINATDQDPSQA
jgi:hypothetical protein